jgi:threonine synthase
VIIYPTGGGTGLIGIWKAFEELRRASWIAPDARARLYSVQSEGCAPVVRAFDAGEDKTSAWENPVTTAAGLRVPNPLGGAIILRALNESDGRAIAVSDPDLENWADRVTATEGIDMCPEGGATVAALVQLLSESRVRPDERVVLFNTGAGWLYR